MRLQNCLYSTEDPYKFIYWQGAGLYRAIRQADGKTWYHLLQKELDPLCKEEAYVYEPEEIESTTGVILRDPIPYVGPITISGKTPAERISLFVEGLKSSLDVPQVWVWPDAEKFVIPNFFTYFDPEERTDSLDFAGKISSDVRKVLIGRITTEIVPCSLFFNSDKSLLIRSYTLNEVF